MSEMRLMLAFCFSSEDGGMLLNMAGSQLEKSNSNRPSREATKITLLAKEWLKTASLNILHSTSPCFTGDSGVEWKNTPGQMYMADTFNLALSLFKLPVLLNKIPYHLLMH